MTIRQVVDAVIDNSLLLLFGAVSGLVWANVSPHGYAAAAHTLHFAVNDIGMALFFAIAAKEVTEATLPGGPLASRRRAAVPLLAAVGGMVVPAAIFIGLARGTGETALLRGWAIPTATDIAFGYLVVRFIFGQRSPAVPFLLLLAIADDALGLLTLAVFYPAGPLRLLEFTGLLGAAMSLAWVLRRRNTQSFWPYMLVAGTVSWVAFFRGGLHPALALAPIVPFLPHGVRAEADLGLEHHTAHAGTDALSRLQDSWRVPVQLILFFFGLINAGVPIGNVGPGTWIVMAALLIGKPLGILLFTAAAVLSGLHRPSGVSWRDLTVVGVTAGIGFTVSLFFATAAFKPGLELDEAKMGALLSFGAGIAAIALARFLKSGRFQTS